MHRGVSTDRITTTADVPKYGTVAKYPDQNDEPILELGFQSGSMRIGVYMRSILMVSVCATGVRVGMFRLFGPFCRDFFVPWEDVTVIRKTVLFLPVAKLQFGSPVVGTLSISGHLADRLARAATRHWPEAGPFPKQTRGDNFRRILREGAVAARILSALFILVQLMHAPRRPSQILVPILFLAIFVGVISIGRFFWREED